MSTEREVAQVAGVLIGNASAEQQSFSGGKTAFPSGDGEKAAELLNVARDLLQQRRSRKQFLPKQLFHEPAWDLLLSLFIAHEQGQRMNVLDAVKMGGVSSTTSLRWIGQLVDLGLAAREADSIDRRCVKLSLSKQGAEMISAYVRSLLRKSSATE